MALRDADARRRLEDSELKFRLLAESSPAMMVSLQKEGAVYLNPQLMRLTGYSHDELMQTSLWDLLHPDDRDMVRSYRGRRLRDQTAPSSYEARILTKSGETRWPASSSRSSRRRNRGRASGSGCRRCTVRSSRPAVSSRGTVRWGTGPPSGCTYRCMRSLGNVGRTTSRRQIQDPIRNKSAI